MPVSSGKSPIARRLLVGAATNWLAFAATLLVGFFLTPYLVRRLGDGPYGVWAFVESLIAYFTLFDLGIAACVVRFVARFHATGDRDDLNRLVSTCLGLFIGLGTLVFLIGAALLPFLLSFMTQSGVPDSEVLAFALLMLGNLAITLPLSVFPSILDGLERFALKSAIRIVVLMIRTIGTVVLLERSNSLFQLGLLFTACTILEHLACAVLACRTLPELHYSWRSIDRATLSRVRGYSLHAFLAMVAGRTCVQSGAIVVGAFLGPAPVTYFVLASRLVEFAKALLRSATNTLAPAVSSMEASGDTLTIQRVLLRGTRWVLYLILPVHLGLVVFGHPFLTVWLGDASYADHCYPPLVILSSTLSLVVAQSVASRILYGTGHLKWFARAALLEASANVLLGVVLGMRFGIVGVALGAAIPNLAMCLWVIGHTARRLEIRLTRYLADAWVRPIVAAAMPLSVWILVDWAVVGWGSLVTAILSGLIPYGILIVVFETRLSLRKTGAVLGIPTGRSATT